MAQDLIEKVSLASSLESHDGRKGEDFNFSRYRRRKFVAWTGFVILLSVGCLVSTISFTRSAKAGKNQKPTKTKRFVEFDGNDSKKNTKVQQVSQMEMTSIARLVSGDRAHRRVGKHPNHRYVEMESKDKLYKKMMKDLYAESGWSPKPLAGGVRGTRAQGVPKKKPRAPEPPMRLKGFYIQPQDEKITAEDQDYQFSDNYYYLREINELMRNDSREREKEENWLMEKDLKSHGLPFRPPAKEFEPAKSYQTSHSRTKNYWAKSGSKKKKRKPLTILLEVYPMSDPNNPRQPFERPGFEPLMTSASSLQNKIFAKNKNKNKMLMKLTLYPKKRENEEDEEDIRNFHSSDDDKRAERRTFSLFSKKKKKKHVKECLVIGLYPYKKPVTAKWKDEDGDWIYAKHLTVKHLEDDYHWE